MVSAQYETDSDVQEGDLYDESPTCDAEDGRCGGDTVRYASSDTYGDHLSARSPVVGKGLPSDFPRDKTSQVLDWVMMDQIKRQQAVSKRVSEAVELASQEFQHQVKILDPGAQNDKLGTVVPAKIAMRRQTKALRKMVDAREEEHQISNTLAKVGMINKDMYGRMYRILKSPIRGPPAELGLSDMMFEPCL